MDYSKSQQELIEYANDAINELVYEKSDLQKAYNYYHGERDAELFRYLEENYGIGNATSLQFTPLIKKHVDVLIGEYLGMTIIPKISCKDEQTVSNMNREREIAISREVYQTLQKRLQNKLLDFVQSQDENKLVDPQIKSVLDKIIEDLNSNFTSKYEIAAQNVVLYIIQSRQIDLITKLRQMFLDLLVTGYTFYKVSPSADASNIEIEVLDPLNVFIDKNINSPYIKNSYRAVVRRWLTKTEILNRYGKNLSKADRDTITDLFSDDKYSSKYATLYTDRSRPTSGILADTEVRLGLQNRYDSRKTNYNWRRIPVYEVEWLETDKDFVMQRYEVIRIGEEVFVVNGKDENVQRSISNPTVCSLTVNGVYFDNRNLEPFSLVKSCMGLLDRYDLLLFYRDSIISNSGTIGDWVDVSLLPQILGPTVTERLQKFIAYKKSGIGVIDTSLEGRLATGQAPINTIFNGFDDTVKAPAIQAILLAIDSVENTMCSITGVFRERLNGIEARDAVTNVKVGQSNSFTVTRHWFQQMDITLEELLTDALNLAKRVYRNGLSGTIILGEHYLRVFTALPEYFTMTDHDVHVIASSDIVRDVEQIKQIVPTFAQSGLLPADVIIDVMDTKSLTDAKHKVKLALQKQKEEQNVIGLLQQQLQEALLQLKQMQDLGKQAEQQIQQLSNQVQQLNERKLQLEAEKNDQDAKIRWFEAQTERNFKTRQASNDDKRTEIELEQLNDGNPNNDDVRQMHY